LKCKLQKKSSSLQPSFIFRVYPNSTIEKIEMKTKRTLLGFLVLVGILGMSSCTRERVIVPSKKVITEDIYVADFDRLRVGSAFTVYVNFENHEDLSLEVNENLMEYVEAKVVNGELRIELEDKVNLRRGAELRAYVGAKYLDGLSASGASRIYLRDRLFASNLSIDVSGASRIKGQIDTDFTDANVSGASDLDLEGSADEMELDASGASNVSGFGLTTNILDVDLSGASKAELTNEGEMTLRLSGASIFRYKGNGVIRSIETSGASKVQKK
jgi:hypothetical protein